MFRGRKGKNQLTTAYQWLLAGWARRMSWKDVAVSFRVSWDHVCNSVKQAIPWGLSHRSLDGRESIGIDEVQWQKGHKYQTVFASDAQSHRTDAVTGEDTSQEARSVAELVSGSGKTVIRCC